MYAYLYNDFFPICEVHLTLFETRDVKPPRRPVLGLGLLPSPVSALELVYTGLLYPLSFPLASSLPLISLSCRGGLSLMSPLPACLCLAVMLTSLTSSWLSPPAPWSSVSLLVAPSSFRCWE